MTVPSTPAALKAAISFEDFNALVAVDYDEKASAYIGHDYWRTTRAFRYYFNDPSLTTYVEVPAGYLTDGATVPRLFWNILPPWGRYGQAAILHDYLREHLTKVVKGQTVSMSRPEADKAFKEGMKALAVPRWKRNVMYIAVVAYATLRGIKGVDIDSSKAAYLAKYPDAIATLPTV